jgi:hypothetical protein
MDCEKIKPNFAQKSNFENLFFKDFSLNFGIVSDVNDEHPEKHLFPRDITEFGMFKIFKCVHSKKYSSGKQVTI